MRFSGFLPSFFLFFAHFVYDSFFILTATLCFGKPFSGFVGKRGRFFEDFSAFSKNILVFPSEFETSVFRTFSTRAAAPGVPVQKFCACFSVFSSKRRALLFSFFLFHAAHALFLSKTLQPIFRYVFFRKIRTLPPERVFPLSPSQDAKTGKRLCAACPLCRFGFVGQPTSSTVVSSSSAGTSSTVVSSLSSGASSSVSSMG